jgi:hypothetical protein
MHGSTDVDTHTGLRASLQVSGLRPKKRLCILIPDMQLWFWPFLVVPGVFFMTWRFCHSAIPVVAVLAFEAVARLPVRLHAVRHHADYAP